MVEIPKFYWHERCFFDVSIESILKCWTINEKGVGLEIYSNCKAILYSLILKSRFAFKLKAKSFYSFNYK